MGRAGRSGGGSRSHSSGGSHSFSSRRSGSSHSFSRSSSGRAGRSSGAGYGGRSGIYYGGSRSWGGAHYGYGYGGYGMGFGRFLSMTIFIVIAFLLVCSILITMSATGANIPANTTNREKLELGYGYSNETLVDELGWIKNPARLNRELKNFYDITGVVPYIALVYRPDVSVGGNDVEYDYADRWYTEHLSHEGYILLMYFSSGAEESGIDGNCQLIVGKQAASLMDAEAQEILWAYLDQYWFSDSDEDTLFAETFNKTAERIMQRQTTGHDVLVKFISLTVVVLVIVGVVIVMKLKRKHEAERAQETARILSQPLRDSTPSADEDDLLSQYEDNDT